VREIDSVIALSVNVNKVALLRNARRGSVPDPVRAARICEDAGAHGITVHPRPDQRHIRPGDVYAIAEAISVELNIEGNPFSPAQGEYPGLIELVRRARPAQVTLVPDAVGQTTSDHGWDLDADAMRLEPIVAQLKSRGCRVSLFMDAVPERIGRARAVGADRVELYTEDYARAHAQGQGASIIRRYRDSALAASDAGLGVNAGHDLNLDNLTEFSTQVPGLLEVSIGQALIADALELGLAESVRRYLTCIARGEQARESVGPATSDRSA
jgi:pyridoxine 5-phosphate synthase